MWNADVGVRCGSVPEIVVEGVSGLIVDSVNEAVASIERLVAMDRAAVRGVFENRFTGSRIARDYVPVRVDPECSRGCIPRSARRNRTRYVPHPLGWVPL